jgi:hypothetical protein
VPRICRADRLVKTHWRRNRVCIRGAVPADVVRFPRRDQQRPDNDIVSWSIDFGDGTSTSGNWSTEPPAVITHTYAGFAVISGMPSVTLTVIDGAGQSATDTMTMFVVDVSPD